MKHLIAWIASSSRLMKTQPKKKFLPLNDKRPKKSSLSEQDKAKVFSVSVS